MVGTTGKRLALSVFLAMAMTVAALVCATLARPAFAADIVVTTYGDEDNSDGDCSLREAIIAANTDTQQDDCTAGSGSDTITVPTGTYRLTATGAGEDDAATGDLDIMGTTTISGEGARATVVRGDTGFDDRIFDNRGTTEISGLTISGGNAGSTDDGGGVRNTAGDLTLDEVSVSDNATEGRVGGVFSEGGGLDITDSTVSGNEADGGRGGVYLKSGIANIKNSTISGNLGIGVVVAIYSFMNIRSSTIANNTTTSQGGAISTSVLSDTTVRNSIVSANNTTTCFTETGSSTTSLGYNLERANDCGFAQPTDLPNIDPMLEPLSDNGGPTQTHVLPIGSPAIDAGESDQTADQRGVSRPQDGDNNGSAIDDIGALESEVPLPPPPPFTVNDSGDAGDVDITDDRCDTDAASGRQCTLRAAIEEANDTAGADTIDFDLGGTGATAISPASALPTISDPVTIDGYTQAGASPNTLKQGNDAVLNVLLGGLGAGAHTNGLEIEADDCTIKGLLIRNFDGSGITITGPGARGNRIEGNFIGVNRDGITARGNGHGVYIGADSNTVGGTLADARNVISGNDQNGVFFDSAAMDNKIEGNFIGSTADGKEDLGNGENGALLQGGAWSNVVGGTQSGAANRIARNGGDGVEVTGSDSTGNSILSNRIYGNAELGVDLEGGTEDPDGVTSNDTGDSDAGPDNLQNYPVIRSATRRPAKGDTTISGRLNSIPGEDFYIQCFLTNAAPTSAHGEGLRLLDTTTVSTNTTGNTGFSCSSSFPLLGQIPGQSVTATATNQGTGDTSEFSRNKSIVS